MHREATRILAAIDSRIDGHTKSGAKIEVTYGQVYGVTDGLASVYIVGSRELAETDGSIPEPSVDFRVPSHLTVAASDYVRVSMDDRGDRWIDEVLGEQPNTGLDELLEISVGEPGTPTVSYYDAVIADSPTDYWRLGETSGTTANNEIGARDGVYQNTPTLGVAGPLADGNPAVTLDGSTELISVPDNSAFDFTGSFTIEAWFKHTNVHGTFGDYIVSKGTQVPALWLDTDGTIRFSKTDEGNLCSSSVQINDTNWHHVAVTWDGTTARIYLDRMDVSGTTTVRTFVANSTDLAIGAKWPASGNDNFHGSLDEVAIYNTALTSPQLAAHYDARLVATSGSGAWTETVRVHGDTGQIQWSGAATERDTNLYRSAANVLKTDDSFEVGGHLVLNRADSNVYGGGNITLTTTPQISASLTLNPGRYLFLYSMDCGVSTVAAGQVCLGELYLDGVTQGSPQVIVGMDTVGRITASQNRILTVTGSGVVTLRVYKSGASGVALVRPSHTAVIAIPI